MSILFSAILNFFKAGPDKPPITSNKEKAKALFNSTQRSVFISITLGYAFFYVCRLNFSVVKKPLLDGNVLDANQIGTMGMVFFFTYAIGKFINSFIGDRCNIKHFMPFGLFMVAVLSIIMGVGMPYVVMVLFWGLIGWFQSYGAGPSIISLNQWVSGKKRGTYYGIWFASHNIGAGLTYLVTSVVVMQYGWHAGFWLPGALCLIASLLMFKFMADRPRACGLPTPYEINGEKDPTIETNEKSIGSLQWEVIKRPAVWILGISSAACYITRYAIESWGVVFLTAEKGYTMLGASSLLTTMQFAGIFGTCLCGLISDKFFNHKRNVPCLIFGILYAASVAAFVWGPKEYDWINWVSMCVYGFTMGSLVCYLGGLMAVDICPKRATGAAMGMIGLFSYIGASLQEKVSGYLINAGKTVVNGQAIYDFHAAAVFWVGAAVISCLMAILVWNVKVKE
ncbi:MFS transporter [Pectinatus cerevisiiphilus]|uniref:MFS transporter n=1 Tax=Pectinatus cerevisiiphilus TaxID=86956 RepID=UPI0039BEEC54